VLERLSSEISTALRQPETREKMIQLGYEPVGSTAAEFAAFQAEELPRGAELVRVSGATPN
jgi:tripartite-type tricarboxylate transporter receptor subunit TctC